MSNGKKFIIVILHWRVATSCDKKQFANVFQAAAEKEKARAKAAEKAAGGGGKERAKSPGKGKGGGKKTPEPQQAKEGSKLRKRGEEDPDGKYIGTVLSLFPSFPNKFVI